MEPIVVWTLALLAIAALVGLCVFLSYQAEKRQDAAYEYFEDAEVQARNAKFETLQRIAHVKANSAFTDTPRRQPGGDIIQGDWE